MSQHRADIVIFGANCGKCKRAEANIRAVIKNYNITANVSKCEDWEVMMQNNVTLLPAVMIDQVMLFKGIVPSEKELEKVLLHSKKSK